MSFQSILHKPAMLVLRDNFLYSLMFVTYSGMVMFVFKLISVISFQPVIDHSSIKAEFLLYYIILQSFGKCLQPVLYVLKCLELGTSYSHIL